MASGSINLDIKANAGAAKKQLDDLQKQLEQISNMKIEVGAGNLTADIEKASNAAMQLSAHLSAATNQQTGNLDFTKFYTSIQKSGASLEEYGVALQKMGPAGQKAFMNLADSISKSEIPLKRTSKMMDGLWDNLKKTVGWQISSSMVHGFIGSMQQAIGYAKDLDRSLNDIRIVTGQSGEQMATFAKQANIAAKQLSTTTTDYTKASLIYYQQGLSDQEVKARTETTIKMANATGQSAQTVSDQMTAIWNNYDNGTKSLSHYADVMTALGASTASSTDEIAEGLQKFASISNTVGLSYEYAASALATVTSTTRESADVVGNSFKTLFSRIQGLQLGETLDDGTTLNKYSTALASVGISIKDQSGELKSMDNILNEMGETWGTLAKDEKMALAQTVAGVRQYTQLMALMENWDFFKQNLNTANNSSGALDKQVAIYEESWSAAADRMKASMEGVWDSLIKSDSAIGVMDFFSNILSGVETLVDGLGGAKGVLSGFGAIMMKVFSPQIAKGVSDVAFNIGMMFGGHNRMEKSRGNFLAMASESLSQDYNSPYGEREGLERRNALQSQLKSSIAYQENKDRMSPFQQAIEQEYQKRAASIAEARIETGKKYDAAKAQAYEGSLGFHKVNEEKDANGKTTKTTITSELDEVFTPSGKQEYKREKNQAQDLLDERDNKITPAMLADKEKMDQIDDYYKKNPNLTRSDEDVKAYNAAKKSYLANKAKAKSLTDQANIEGGNSYDAVMHREAQAMTKLKEALSGLDENTEDSAGNLEKVNKAFADFKESTGHEVSDNLKNQAAAALEGDSNDVKYIKANMGQWLDEMDESFIDDLDSSYVKGKPGRESQRDSFKQRYSGLKGMYGAESDLNKLQLDEDARKKNLESRSEKWADSLASAAQGAASVMALNSAIDALASGSGDAATNITSVISGLASFAGATDGFADAIKGVTNLSTSASLGLGAAIAVAGVLVSQLYNYFNDIKNADKNAAVEAAKTAEASKKAAEGANRGLSKIRKRIRFSQLRNRTSGKN